MNITYTQNCDYLIPNIIIRKTKPLGHYGIAFALQLFGFIMSQILEIIDGS